MGRLVREKEPPQRLVRLILRCGGPGLKGALVMVGLVLAGAIVTGTSAMLDQNHVQTKALVVEKTTRAVRAEGLYSPAAPIQIDLGFAGLEPSVVLSFDTPGGPVRREVAVKPRAYARIRVDRQVRVMYPVGMPSQVSLAPGPAARLARAWAYAALAVLVAAGIFAYPSVRLAVRGIKVRQSGNLVATEVLGLLRGEVVQAVKVESADHPWIPRKHHTLRVLPDEGTRRMHNRVKLFWRLPDGTVGTSLPRAEGGFAGIVPGQRIAVYVKDGESWWEGDVGRRKLRT